ncbi:unnamed protein product [Mytilus edulis]|uniref:Uncharacterized protein n=1 Tax=Mytilus edulis TaxID=6550 RepID=A0A8S3RLP4_MYTED|nr:unnamed protein product [Mytilus edulis]
MKNWYCQQPINTFSSTQFDVSALYHALLHERRETRIGCLIRMSETFLGELMQQCNAANSVQSRDMLQIALDILKDRIHHHNAMVMLSRDSLWSTDETPPVDGQESAGHLVLVVHCGCWNALRPFCRGVFHKPLSQPQEQVVLKENAAPVYAPPPPPTPSAPLTLIYENEATPLQTDPMWNKGSTIPVRVATKRREESLPQWVSKTAKYEQVSPVKNNLYNLSEEEMGAFFQTITFNLRMTERRKRYTEVVELHEVVLHAEGMSLLDHQQCD